jgi:c(7)-type cytochrome triheme protein
MKPWTLFVAISCLLLPAARAQDGAKSVFDSVCVACHGTGVLGAPKPGDAAQWRPRLQAGMDALVKRAIAGSSKGMPPRGGRADLSDAQFRAVIELMVGSAAAAAPAATAAAPASAPAPSSMPATVPVQTRTAAQAAEVNSFNRLLKPQGRFNRPAMESGIHDPSNDMTAQLQPPALAFATLPKSLAGNQVDWVKALDQKGITPRWDRNVANAPAVVMDLNIVREVKGSMPDVVYPHKQHTEWLDCSNCHPAIFAPQKGANQISMASILLGQQCGVCHGKVAFPVSECRLCHSRKKPGAATAEAKP